MHKYCRLLLFVLMSFLFWNCEEVTETEDTTETFVEEEKEEELLYGFPVDSFEVVQSTVKNNQYFSEILLPHHIPYNTIDYCAKNCKDTFDIRKIRTGNPYTLFLSKDSTKKAEILVYEIDKINYVVFDFRDSTQFYKQQKPKRLVLRESSGVINASLYLSMLKNGLNPLLSNKLADIYAWTIDFYRIQKGDRFKVIYEEVFVDSVSIGIQHIKSAMFEHRGEKNYAIYFEQEGVGDYYDQNSRSLRKPFLKAPVKFSRISSRYTQRRYHPVTGGVKPHLGTDYAAASGTPIVSTANGTVIRASYSKYNGNYVKVKHNATYTTQYLHMSKIKSGIKPGVRVKQGDVIGFVGATGLATGPHVCYRFWKNGRQVDPFKQDLPQSEPIKKQNLATYNKIKKRVMKELEAIPYPSQKEI